MKFFILFAALFAVALAAPRPDAEILKQDSEVGPEDFRFAVGTSDGTEHNAEGKVKDVGTDHAAIVVHGSYTWVDEKTGEKFTVEYVADENGFQPKGAHLPIA